MRQLSALASSMLTLTALIAYPAGALARGHWNLSGPALGTDGQTTFYLTVLHNNDGESQLINAGPGQLENFGGVARFKTLVDNLKGEALVYPPGNYERGWVMISSGDNFLAGPEFSISLEKGVPYYDTIAMDLIGYTGLAIGNHEFDFGPDIFENFVKGFEITEPEPFLTANLDFSQEPGLQALVDQGRIARSMIATVGTRQIGIVGATTETLPFVSSPRKVIVNKVLPAVQAEVASLVGQGVKIIILTSHLQGLFSEFGLLPDLKDVDIIIGGGGGELLANPTDLLIPGDVPWPTELGGTGYPRVGKDSTGRDVPVVTTKGDYRYVGRLIVGFDDEGNVTAIDQLSGPRRVSGVDPDKVEPDPVVQVEVVDPVKEALAELAKNVIAVSEVPLDGRRSQVRTRETNEGNLIADSLFWTAFQLAGKFGAPLPDVALQNGGGIRNDSIYPVGNITELNTFEMVPFANFVCVVESIPPQQFKEILENCVSRVEFSDGRFCQIAGFRMVWNTTGQAQLLDPNGNVTRPGTRVVEVALDDGRAVVRGGQIVPGAPTINIATIDFLARGGDQYPFRGAKFTTLGVSYQLSLRNYIEEYLSGRITAREYREGGEGRSTSVTRAQGLHSE